MGYFYVFKKSLHRGFPKTAPHSETFISTPKFIRVSSGNRCPHTELTSGDGWLADSFNLTVPAHVDV